MRRLSWDACHNARDLGGLPTRDGGVIRPLALIRTDNHDRLTPAGQAALRESGAVLILDLRSAWEARTFPSPFTNDPIYRHAPLLDDGDAEGTALVNAAPDLPAFNQVMLSRFPYLVGRAISAMADAPAGGVVVHCHSGKDRTGVIVALALSVANVDREVIAEEYALTAECLRASHEAELERAAPEKRETLRTWQASAPEIIVEMFDVLDRDFGGVTSYLRASGVSEPQLKRLRERLRSERGTPAVLR